MAKYSNTIQYNITTKLDASGFSQLQAQIKGVEGLLNNLSNKRIIDYKQFSEATTHVKNLQTALSNAFNVNTGMLNAQKFFDTLASKNTSLTQLASSFSTVGSKGQIAFTNLLGSLGKLDTQLKTTNTTLSKIGTTFGNTVRWGVIASVFQEVMNSAHRAVQYMEDLDKSLTDIQMVGHSSATEMRQLALEANEAAKAIGSTTVAYTDATKIFVQQGLSLEESQQFAEMSLKLANVAGESAADAAEQITALKNGFQMAGDSVESSLDKIVKTSHITASSVEELATASTRVAATANALGVTDEQLYSQLATIIQVTREAPEIVGNSLKTLYARFADLKLGETLEDGMDLGMFSGTLEDLGVQVLDSNGQLREMGSIIEDLMAKWDTFDRATKQGAAVTLAGKFQYNRLLTLMENADAYRETLDKLQNDTDVEGLLSNKNDEVYLDSLEGKMNQLKSSFEGLMTSLYDQRDFAAVLDFFKNATDGATTFFDAIGGGIPTLTLLGSTLTRVFSNQIAGQISNMMTNSVANNQRKNNSVIAQNELQRYYNQSMVGPVGPNTTKEIQEAEAALAKFMAKGNELQGIMNERQLEGWNRAIDEGKASIVELIQDTAALTEQNERLAIALNAMPDYNADQSEQRLTGEDVQAQLKDGFYTDETLQQANVALEKLKTQYQEIRQLTSELQKAEAFSESDVLATKYGEKLLTLLDRLQQLNQETNTLSPEAYEKITTVIDKLEKGFQDLTEDTDKAGISVDELNDTLRYLDPAVLREIDSQLEVIGSGQIKETTVAFEELDAKMNASKAVIESYGQSFQQMEEEMNQQVKIRGIVDSIGAVGQLAFVWQSFQSLGSLWANSEVDTGEKILQTIINLGMNIPMLLTSFEQLQKKDLGSALKKWNVELGTNSAIIQRWKDNINKAKISVTQQSAAVKSEIVAEKQLDAQVIKTNVSLKAQQAALTALSGASKVATVATTLLGKALDALSNPKALIGIFALTAAYDLLAEARAKAQEKLSQGMDEYNTQNELASIDTSSYDELYKQYTKNKVASDDLKNAAIELAEQLGIVGGSALAESGNFDILNNKIDDAIQRHKELADIAATGQLTSIEDELNNYHYFDNNDFQHLLTDDLILGASVIAERTELIAGNAYDIETILSSVNNAVDKAQKNITDLKEQQNGLIDKIDDPEERAEQNRILQEKIDAETEIYKELTKLVSSDNLSNAATILQNQAQNLETSLLATKEIFEGLTYNQIAKLLTDEDGDYTAIAQYYASLGTEAGRQYLDSLVLSLGDADVILTQTLETTRSHVVDLFSHVQLFDSNGLAIEALDNVFYALDYIQGVLNSCPDDQKLQLVTAINSANTLDELFNLVDEWQRSGKIPEIEISAKANFAEMEPIDADVDVDEFQALGQYLQQNAHLLDDFNNEIETNADLLAEVTEAQLRYDAALKRSFDSMEDWEDALNNKKEVTKYATALDELNNTYKDLLDIGQDLDLSSDFTGSIDNLELLKAAIEGDTDAYNALVQAATEDILIHAGVDLDQFDSELGIIFSTLDAIQAEGLTDIEIDAMLNSEGFIQALEEIINAAHMTEDQANAYMSMIGVSADVQTEINEEEAPQVAVGWRAVPDAPVELTGTAPSRNPLTGELGPNEPFSYSVPGFKYEPVPAESAGIISSGGFSLQTTAGNGATNEQTLSISNVKKINTGGSKARNTSARRPSSGGGGGGGKKGGGGGKKGGGGGGGGGSAYEAKTKEKLEDEIDRYERVDTLLESVEKQYTRVNKERERLTGFEMADAMTEEVALLKDQIALHKEKLKIQQQEAEELRNTLSSDYGATFDGEGFLSNYASIHQRLIDEVNSLIDQYNATTTEEGQEALAEQIDAAKEKLDKFKETYERYDSLWAGDLQETLNTLEDLEDQIEDIHIEAVKTQVDAVENLKDLNEQLIEFNAVFSGLDKKDPLRDMITSAAKLEKYFDDGTDSANDFYNTLLSRYKELQASATTDSLKKWYELQIKQVQEAQQNVGKPMMDVRGTGYLDMELTNLQMILEQLKQYKATGTSDFFGENEAELYEVAKDIFNSATDMVMDLEDEIDNLHDAIIDAIDEIGDALDDRREQYEQITDELDHQLEIWELLHGDEDYSNINQILQMQQNNYQQSIKELMQQKDLLEDLLTGLNEGSEEWKNVQEMIVETQEELNDLVEESLKNLQQQYENNVSSILDAWTADTPLGSDLDWMEEQWELINRNADYYLDDVNASYEIQKLQKKYLDLLDDAGNASAAVQSKITAQMQQQLAYLREKEKISEYDVAYAEAQLEILQRQIALEEAQQNKSQLKLRRDSQGNYNYVYTAKEEDNRDLEQDYLDAQNNAYNLSKEQMKQTQQDALSAMQDAKKLLADIWNDSNLDTAEKAERAKTVIDSLKEYLAGTSEQLSESQKNIINDFIGMCEILTDENDARLQEVYEQIVQGNNDAFNEIDERWGDSIAEWMHDMDDFMDATDNMFEDLVDNAVDYQDQIDIIADIIQQDFNNVADSINTARVAMEDLAATNRAFIDQLEADSGVIRQYESTMNSYADQVRDANNAMAAYREQVEDLQSQLTAKERENANLADQIANRDSKYTSGYLNGGAGGEGDGAAGYSLGALTEGIAGNIWTYGTWGDGGTRLGRLKEKFGDDKGQQIYNGVQQLFNGKPAYGYEYNPNAWATDGYGYYRSFAYSAFDTGGYTGEWSDGDGKAKNGKLAWLHSKELVLNEKDTQYILQAVDAVRNIVQTIKGGTLENLTKAFNNSSTTPIEQQISNDTYEIHAEFPNANNVEDIREAIMGLPGYANQVNSRYR